MKKTFLKIWKDESGQGATEYILMIVVVVGMIMVLKKPITDMVTEKVEDLKSQVGAVKPGN
ncbi:MAG: Flp family type IVb pilin, partial [Bdellovibrionales bacterium]